MDLSELLPRLVALGDRDNVKGMARFGIVSERVLGISMVELRRIAKEIGRDHQLALSLWDTGIHESRILAILIEVPEEVTEEQVDRWVSDLDNWALCDGLCIHLLRYLPFAYLKCQEWSGREEEFVKRAAYALIAALAVGDKRVPDSRFEALLPLIRTGAVDDRNYVRKAVRWALRQIGKRSEGLHPLAVQLAEELRHHDSRSARWIASDVLAELRDPKVLRRMGLPTYG